MNEKIPKIIHYCWFGKSVMPKIVLKRIKKWKRILKDYEFIEWNENNFPISEANSFVKEAYQKRKWAFVSDYVRLYALSIYGGIYLDTDVVVLNSFDKFLDDKMFISYESEKSLCTAVIGAQSNNSLIKEFMKTYDGRKFLLENGNINNTPNSELIYKYISSRYNNMLEFDVEKLFDNVHIYKFEYFCAKNIHNYKILRTENTVSIHMLDATWYPIYKKVLKFCKKIIMRFINFFR